MNADIPLTPCGAPFEVGSEAHICSLEAGHQGGHGRIEMLSVNPSLLDEAHEFVSERQNGWSLVHELANRVMCLTYERDRLRADIAHRGELEKFAAPLSCPTHGLVPNLALFDNKCPACERDRLREALPVADAFEAGWRTAANWMERDDLHADVGSPAYCADRAKALAKIY